MLKFEVNKYILEVSLQYEILLYILSKLRNFRYRL